MANPSEVKWLIKQWEDVLTKQQFMVSDILRLLIKDTIEALKSVPATIKREVTMATEVEILGHKAKIESVSGQVKDLLHRKFDQLVVWLSFDEAVDSTLSFAIYLPAKKYADRAEFLYHVRRRGEEALKRILERDEKENREREEREQRKAVLDALAAEAQKLIE